MTARDEGDAGPPRIGPVPGGADRPSWSVMIPTYNASGYLEEALRSVLDQDPGPGAMQIAVVDDRSPNGEAERVVARLAPGRVEFLRNAANLGLAGNWNACLALARGRWVHLLHQDDLVLPGFYDRMGAATRAEPAPGAAFCQHAFIDGRGLWTSISALERRDPGVLDGWVEALASYQRIQCPAIVVSRAAYEDVGGFDPGLKFALDWEMWMRISARYPVWFEPTVLACYRQHASSETARLKRGGDDLVDVRRAIEVVRRYVPPAGRGAVGRGMLAELGGGLLADATALFAAGDRRGGLAKLREAVLCDRSLRFSGRRASYAKWAAKLWLRDVLAGRPGRA